jgi:pimeloyl-ACP methyl ester carboxylesterase
MCRRRALTVVLTPTEGDVVARCVVVEHLDLREVNLVGFSMGTGEVTRYLGRYGSARARRRS